MRPVQSSSFDPPDDTHRRATELVDRQSCCTKPWDAGGGAACSGRSLLGGAPPEKPNRPQHPDHDLLDSKHVGLPVRFASTSPSAMLYARHAVGDYDDVHGLLADMVARAPKPPALAVEAVCGERVSDAKCQITGNFRDFGGEKLQKTPKRCRKTMGCAILAQKMAGNSKAENREFQTPNWDSPATNREPFCP